MQLKPYDPNIH